MLRVRFSSDHIQTSFNIVKNRIYDTIFYVILLSKYTNHNKNIFYLTANSLQINKAYL